MKDELVVLVDEQGRLIGTDLKSKVHTKKTPLHLGFSCYVFNEKGDFLLTQRAKSKKTFPGVWTNSCCGHPSPGEKLEEAVRRRLKLELGLKPRELELVLPNFRYTATMNGIMENEICPVFIARVNTNPEINKEEVENFRWIKWEDFLKDIKINPKKYSKWSREQAKLLANLRKS